MRKLSRQLLSVVFSGMSGPDQSGAVWFGLQGEIQLGAAGRGPLQATAAQLRFALQESIAQGGVYLLHVGDGAQWVFALEDARVVRGGLTGAFCRGVSQADLLAAGERAFTFFYRESGWVPVLLEERRREWLRRAQEVEAARQQEQYGGAQYAFEKERMLLAHVRAGDRTGARRLLNEMLASIYLSVPQPVVLRARVMELLSSLTRAAVEDNPLFESLIEQNLHWMERMMRADSFESLSTTLMASLDEFLDAVQLHGSNRTNAHVHKALSFISRNYHESLGLQEVARHTGLSPYRLAHLFREHTGSTVIETIRQLRLRRAETLLRQSGMTCAEVGYAVGFTDQSYFSLHFKRHAGVSPGQYRRSQGARG
jgi:two-component system, response regulator YesN